MRVYASSVAERFDRIESRMLGVERATSAPATPKSVVSISSQNTPDGKHDSTDVESNPDEAEIEAELGKKHNTHTHTLSLVLLLSSFSTTAESDRKTGEAQEKERATQ